MRAPLQPRKRRSAGSAQRRVYLRAMADLDVVALLKCKAGQEARVKAALTALVEPTRTEAGCISYELFQSNVDASTFITIEKWRSQADLDLHMTTAHMKQLQASVGDAMEAPPAVHPLTVIVGAVPR
jgi:quinol monooxygenase YgiN